MTNLQKNVQMRCIAWFAMAGLLFLLGCMPRWITVHDGLATTVMDASTKRLLSNAFAFASWDAQGQPQMLARSDGTGKLYLEPKRKLEMVILLGEGMIPLGLWVCKEGYEPQRVASRGGWNADFSVQIHQVDSVELVPSTHAAAASCQRPSMGNPA